MDKNYGKMMLYLSNYIIYFEMFDAFTCQSYCP